MFPRRGVLARAYRSLWRHLAGNRWYVCCSFGLRGFGVSDDSL